MPASTEPRTFTIQNPAMTGDDIASWQKDVRNEFARMGIDCPIAIDGKYGPITRSFTASLCHALGMTASHEMRNGITPSLRTQIRNRNLSATQRERYEERKSYRRDLRARWSKETATVALPVKKILADSWGYHPGVHDGVDVICAPDVPVFAMVKSKVIDVRSGGWWGKAPSGDVAKGDGIVQLEILESVGPFIKGYHIGYGHCEKANVSVGDIVSAGQQIAHAGLAVAWHIHLMYNDGSTTRGIGNRDPSELLDYVKAQI